MTRRAAWRAVVAFTASFWLLCAWVAIRSPAPRPVDRSVAYCAPRPMLAESFHPCRNENVLVSL